MVGSASPTMTASGWRHSNSSFGRARDSGPPTKILASGISPLRDAILSRVGPTFTFVTLNPTASYGEGSGKFDVTFKSTKSVWIQRLSKKDTVPRGPRGTRL